MLLRLINKIVLRYFRGRGFLTAEHEIRNLLMMALASAFKIFKNKRFRKLVNFYNQDETEQNRLFNELSVTALALLKIMLEDDLPRIHYSRKEFWLEINSGLVDNFTNWLKKLGITDELTSLWKKLLAMRLEEYKDNEAEARHVWHGELMKSQDHIRDEATVRVGTIATSAFLHLRKGEPLEKDPLHRFIQQWTINLNNKIAKRIGW